KDLLIEKIDQIRKYSGEKYEIADVAEAGEIVAVTGLSSTFPGQATHVAGDSYFRSDGDYSLYPSLY
ncbi:hypothetical protein, partial [Alistipes ihumii]|uniref:hypothetical protein n=1 Tax=Alistipes ihumii TaxID=1470347 RepID=UPI003AB862EE